MSNALASALRPRVSDRLVAAGLASIAASPLPRLFSATHSGIGGILTFHRIAERDENLALGARALQITRASFQALVATLRERQYTFVTMSEIARLLRRRECRKSKFICLTFDDGFVDTYTEAFPICRSAGIPMTVYVMTGAMKRSVPMWWLGLEELIRQNVQIGFSWQGREIRLRATTAREKRRAYFEVARRLANTSPSCCAGVCAELEARYGIAFMEITDRLAIRPAMVREMYASGLVEFGAHTISHANLRRLSEGEARQEISGSRQDLMDVLDNEIEHFAYPYGKAHAAGPREFAICRELGFHTAVTTKMGNIFPKHGGELHALPRLSMNGGYDPAALIELLLSGTLPALLAASQSIFSASGLDSASPPLEATPTSNSRRAGRGIYANRIGAMH